MLDHLPFHRTQFLSYNYNVLYVKYLSSLCVSITLLCCIGLHINSPALSSPRLGVLYVLSIRAMIMCLTTSLSSFLWVIMSPICKTYGWFFQRTFMVHTEASLLWANFTSISTLLVVSSLCLGISSPYTQH